MIFFKTYNTSHRRKPVSTLKRWRVGICCNIKAMMGFLALLVYNTPQGNNHITSAIKSTTFTASRLHTESE